MKTALPALALSTPAMARQDNHDQAAAASAKTRCGYGWRDGAQSLHSPADGFGLTASLRVKL